MNQLSTAQDASKGRKLLVQMLVGASLGGITTYLALTALDGSGFDLADPSRLLGLLVGIVLVLMGAVVALGSAMPGPGSRLLNVEDADELREMRKPLGFAAAAVLLIGATMLALALSEGSDWPAGLPRSVAAVVAGAGIMGAAFLSYAGRHGNDELMRSVAQQSAAWAMYAILFVFTVWGSLAHLGYAPWITPLGMVSALMGITLAVSFIVCGARGLLRPR